MAYRSYDEAGSSDRRGAGARRGTLSAARPSNRQSGWVASRRIHEVGIGPARERERGFGRASGRSQGWRSLGKAEVSEDHGDDLGIGDEGDDATTAGASAALGQIDLVHATKQLGPRKVAKAKGCVGRSSKWAERIGVGWQKAR